MTSASEEKCRTTNRFFFSSPGTGGSPWGPDLENRVGDQGIGIPGRLGSSGMQVQVQ